MPPRQPAISLSGALQLYLNDALPRGLILDPCFRPHADFSVSSIPTCSTIDPNESRCVVPDQRFDYLCDLHKPASKIPAYLHVTDIAGLIKGASEGAGLGNAFLSHIAAVDGIFHLVRGFENDEIMHVDDSVDPVRDLETITSELCMKDLDTIDRAIENEKKEHKRTKVRSRSPVPFVQVSFSIEAQSTGHVFWKFRLN